MNQSDMCQALADALSGSDDFTDVEVSEDKTAVFVVDCHGDSWAITPNQF